MYWPTSIVLTCFSMIEDCVLTIKRLVDSGVTQNNAWNQTSIKLINASEVYNIFFYTLNKYSIRYRIEHLLNIFGSILTL